MKKVILLSPIFFSLFFISCSSGSEGLHESKLEEKKELRIVSLNGTITEVLCEIGLCDQLVATDITSNYPEAIAALPKVGHNKNISVEGVLGQHPNYVFSLEGECDPTSIAQMKSAHTKTAVLPFQYSVEGTLALVKALSDTFDLNYNVDSLGAVIKAKLNSIRVFEQKPKVLFIYARGAGTLNVAGKNTKIQSMITLAGAQNVDLDFEDFKPLTAEALVSTNPDVILLFTSGLQSIEGGEGLLKIPGVSETNAGKNKAFVAMDGALLNNFSPRVGDAALELNKQLHRVYTK